jgi:hypothetical protein
MMSYVASRTCPCLRCKASEMLAPSLLVTFGLLLLLSNLHWASFGRTWPILLIVIGGVRLAQSTAPIAGHRGEEATPPTTPASADLPSSSLSAEASHD